MFTGVLDEDYAGSFNVEQHAFTIGPGLHLGLSEKTDVVEVLSGLEVGDRVIVASDGETGTMRLPAGATDIDVANDGKGVELAEV